MQRNFYQMPYDHPSSGGESVIVPQMIEPEPDRGEQAESEPEPRVPQQPAVQEGHKVSLYNPETRKFFDRFCVDDIILIAIILLLVTDSEVDLVTLCILGFIFLLGLE